METEKYDILMRRRILGIRYLYIFIFVFVFISAHLWATGWVIGVRFHPENIQQLLKEITTKQKTPSKNLKKIDLTSGKSIVGEVIHESKSKVVLRLYGGKVDYSRDEIKAINSLDNSEMKAGVYKKEGSQEKTPEQRIFTYNKKQALLYSLDHQLNLLLKKYLPGKNHKAAPSSG